MSFQAAFDVIEFPAKSIRKIIVSKERAEMLPCLQITNAELEKQKDRARHN